MLTDANYGHPSWYCGVKCGKFISDSSPSGQEKLWTSCSLAHCKEKEAKRHCFVSHRAPHLFVRGQSPCTAQKPWKEETNIQIIAKSGGICPQLPMIGPMRPHTHLDPTFGPEAL